MLAGGAFVAGGGGWLKYRLPIAELGIPVRGLGFCLGFRV